MTIATEETERRRLCTIAARNYGPSVRLLVDTFAAHHPGIPVTVLFVDARPEDRFPDFPCEVIAPDALALDRDDFLQMATYYDVTALSTALKPFLLRHLLDRGTESVMYLDPDIEVFAPLDDLFALADEREIVLTPHVMKPMPRDGLNIAEETILASGQFNLGFITLSGAARPFLEYWSERTQMLALSDHSHAYFTDQRWVDAVPVFFEHVVCRDPSCNVAYWNLHERSLDVDASGGWTVDGAPLRFFHYSGHDPTEPLKLSRHVIPPERIHVEELPPLQRLLRERSERMLHLESPDDDAPPYGWKFSADGIELDAMIRRVYWNAVREADDAGQQPPPHAFQGDGRPFTDWLLESVRPGAPLSRFQCALWNEYAHYQRLFPEPLGADAERFIEAARVERSFFDLTPAALRPSLRVAAGGIPGVNLVGYLEGEFGLGEHARMISRIVGASGVPMATTVLRPVWHENRHRYPTTMTGAPFDVSILALNPDALLDFAGTEFEQHRAHRRVGVWAWEAGALPEQMRGAYELVDEIWCASEYVRSLLSGVSDRPIYKHPLAISIPAEPPTLTRADLGLPVDAFVFGFVFDYQSVIARKNPLGLIDAYRRAFSPDDGAALLLKSINAHAAPAASAAVHDAAADRPDIHLVNRHFDAVEMRALYHVLDCYVSLHRSEGTGLTIAAAMAAGTPAIATGWSGNLEFMDHTNSVLIPFEFAEVGADAAPYPEGASWAEPDLDAAATAMRRLFENPDHAAELGRCGRSTIAARGITSDAALWFAERFGALTGIEVRPHDS